MEKIGKWVSCPPFFRDRPSGRRGKTASGQIKKARPPKGGGPLCFRSCFCSEREPGADAGGPGPVAGGVIVERDVLPERITRRFEFRLPVEILGQELPIFDPHRVPVGGDGLGLTGLGVSEVVDLEVE